MCGWLRRIGPVRLRPEQAAPVPVGRWPFCCILLVEYFQLNCMYIICRCAKSADVLCKEDLEHSTHSYIQQLCFPWWRLFLSMQGASADYWLQTLQASKISTSAKHNTSSTQIHIQILMFITNTNTNKEGRHHKNVARIANRSQSQRGGRGQTNVNFWGKLLRKKMVGGWDYFGIFSW